MSTRKKKPSKPPSGPPPWNLDEEFTGSEDISFDDWPQDGDPAAVVAVPPSSPAERKRTSRPPRRSIPAEVPGWPPVEGTVLLGKYQMDKVLGRGGMGVVVVAKHLQLQQRVAIKFLHPAAMEDKDVVIRFQREARVLAQIQSEHVVRILDVGTLEKGEPYMVMEYLEGTDLSKAVKVRGPLPYDEAVDYLIQACEPLAEAHLQHIIHRDLKPSNLYLARRTDGTYTIKVIDFGISKIQTENELSMTKTSVILGSPLYISPEQLRSAKDVDARSDIWALGVIMYKLLTGHPPFMADTIAQLCAMILMNPPPRIVHVRPEVPIGLEEAIFRCIQKDPDQRFQNVGELAEAFAPYLPPDAEANDSLARIRRLLKTAPRPRQEAPPAPTLSSLPPKSTVSGVTDGGSALTLGAGMWAAARDRSRIKIALIAAAGAAFAFMALVIAAIVVVRLRHPSRAPAADLSGQELPPPASTEVPAASADPAAIAPATPPPDPTPSAAQPVATAATAAVPTGATSAPNVSASATARRQGGGWVPSPSWKKPSGSKGVDNSEFGDRK